jgi:hypothetical protein
LSGLVLSQVQRNKNSTRATKLVENYNNEDAIRAPQHDKLRPEKEKPAA